MRTEADIEKAFCAWADRIGAECYKLRVDGVNGFPDRTFIWNGVVIFIEFKRYDGKLRPMQEEFIEALASQKQNVIVSDNLTEVIEFCLEVCNDEC